MKVPLVSVIVVTLNNKDWLLKSLKNLENQDYKNIEIILTDNGSNDGTREAVSKEFPQVILIDARKNIGFGRAANKAIKKARGKYIFVFNDDALCKKDTIGLLVERMEKDNKIGACQGTLLFADKKSLVESAGAFLTPIGILLKKAGNKFDRKKVKEEQIFNANLPLIRKEVLDKVGFFDEDYFLYFEEADLCWRIWLAGFKIIYYPDAVLYHARGVTTRKLKPPLVVESAFGNRINSLTKNLELGSLIKILPLHLIICFGGMFAYLLKRKPEGTIAILKAITRNVRMWPRTKKKREKIQKLRRINDKKLFKKIMRPMSVKYFVDLALDYLKVW